MKLEKAISKLIDETKSICKSNSNCDMCKLHNLCYFEGTDHARFDEYPYEILELLRDYI